MQEARPDDLFPFTVAPTEEGGPAQIELGVALDLQHVRWPYDNGNFVEVTEVTPTSFAVTTLEGHFDGPGAVARFSIYEEDGRIYLQQDGYAPDAGLFNGILAPLGATNMTWHEQAANLRNADLIE